MGTARDTGRTAGAGAARHARAASRPRRTVIPLTARILALNVLALGILVAGLLYLGQYRDGLIEAKTKSLTTEGAIIAGALGEIATSEDGAEDGIEDRAEDERARQIVRRLTEPTGTRALLFAAPGGALEADSRRLIEAGRAVQVEPLPPPEALSLPIRVTNDLYDWVVGRLPQRPRLPPWRERAEPVAADYGEAVAALNGETAGALRVGRDGVAILSVALPVQGYKRIVGALMLVSDTAYIEASVRRVRIAILQVFAVALAITVLLSIYLAGTIARPVRRLAAAAEKVRHGHGRIAIPDFTRRRDEIGHLSHALRDMTEALYERLDAIEAFAADVVHEIRNPLSSLRSAIESLEKVGDDERRSRLTAVIKDDVARLDRLIGEISRASRLDAELSRAEFAAVDIGGLLSALVEVHDAAGKPNIVRLETEIAGGDLIVNGIEERLAQVAENLVGNATSFSSPGGTVRLRGFRDGGSVCIAVEDEGPGIPESALETIFERFYTERPGGEAAGVHSGLGLSIARRIVEAHGGTLSAENRRGAAGRVLGARFVVALPA